MLPFGACLQDRVRYEADALREQHSLCPEHVPAIYHFDPKNALIVMQYLPPPHVILRKAIVQASLSSTAYLEHKRTAHACMQLG